MANGFQNKLCARRRIEMKKFLVAMYSVLLLLVLPCTQPSAAKLGELVDRFLNNIAIPPIVV
jgi:hypothetical protein